MKKLLRRFDKKKLFLRLLYFALAVVILIFIMIRVFGTQKDNSCVFYKTIPAEREELAADFEELVQASDLIVRAKVLPDKEDVSALLVFTFVVLASSFVSVVEGVLFSSPV